MCRRPARKDDLILCPAGDDKALVPYIWPVALVLTPTRDEKTLLEIMDKDTRRE